MPAMGNCTNAMVERILLDIASVFSKDSELEAFDIVPVETNHCNRSPVLHSEHTLGLESWCLKSVFHHCYGVLMGQYVPRAADCRPAKLNMDNCEEVNRLLMGALLINPDVTSFWNKRREMYTKRFLSFIDEMKFTKVLLSRKSKCNDAFAYRKWLLQRFWTEPSGNHCLHVASSAELELKVVHTCASKSPNNYHAWSHRIWLMKQVARRISPPFHLHLCMAELAYSERWISANVSDHSGLHYRQAALTCASLAKKAFCFLKVEEQQKYKQSIDRIMQNIPQVDPREYCQSKTEKEIMISLLGTILENNEDSCKYEDYYQRLCIVLYDLALNEELSKIFSSHEALWCHRRFIVSTLLDIICQYFGEGNFTSGAAVNLEKKLKDSSSNITSFSEESGEPERKEAKVQRHHHHAVYSSSLYKALAANERKVIQQRHKCGDIFSTKYHIWLRCILGFTI